MSISPVAFLPPVAGALPATDAAAMATPKPATAFADFFAQQVNEVNHELLGAQADVRSLALGGSQNLHETMIRLEQSRIAFQLLVQVRNRMLESYQDVMRMQV